MTDRMSTEPQPRNLDRDEAIEKALLHTFQWSDKQYAKMRTALTEAAFVRALEQDGYTVALLDAARAVPALDAELREAQLESYGDWLVDNGLPASRRAAAVQRAGLFALSDQQSKGDT
jgi:hypothetical protein